MLLYSYFNFRNMPSSNSRLIKLPVIMRTGCRSAKVVRTVDGGYFISFIYLTYFTNKETRKICSGSVSQSYQEPYIHNVNISSTSRPFCPMFCLNVHFKFSNKLTEPTIKKNPCKKRFSVYYASYTECNQESMKSRWPLNEKGED
jgi:hypothetical protein